MRLQVNTPCDADWDAMTGDERKRFCDHCSKHVHDLSALTEPEARELLSKPGICGRYRVRPDGHVRFRGQRLTAAALVLSAVFASAPAIAGGKAAPGSEGDWSDWIVEWLVGGEEPAMLGEIEPLPPEAQIPEVQIPEVEPPDPRQAVVPEEVIMGDIVSISPPAYETRTVENRSPDALKLICSGEVFTVSAGQRASFEVPEDEVCRVEGAGGSQNLWEREAVCDRGRLGLRCDQS